MTKVLIIEDEKPIAKALQLKLEKKGFDVEVAPDGECGLERLLTNEYDLALLDLVMPKMDGFGVLEGVHDKSLKTKIIVTSNLSQEEDKKKTKELGAVDYLVKSETPLNDIITRLEKLIV